MPKDLKTVDLPGVEIFATGTWNGDAYTTADLDHMVTAFDALSGQLDPPVKLGHDKGQKLLQSDGYPAAGWVGKIYRKGQKLLADLTGVPEKIAELVKAGAYKKVSSEIYWDYEAGKKVYPRVLKAVAFLGSDIPAVKSIGDIRALYSDGAVVGYYEEGGVPVRVVSLATAPAEPMDEPVTLEELEGDLTELIGAADLAVKNKTGAPVIRAFLREVRTKLRGMMAGKKPTMPAAESLDMPPKKMPPADMPKGDMSDPQAGDLHVDVPIGQKPQKRQLAEADYSLPMFKTEANYRNAAIGETACQDCRFYTAGYDGGIGLGRCSVVEGQMMPGGTCDECQDMPELVTPPGQSNQVMGGMMAEALTKTDGGESYPAAAYLVVPDATKPSTWHLRVWESPTLKVTQKQLGAAAAALSSGGFRGNPVQLAPEDEKAAKAKLRSLYRGLGVKDAEIPPHLLTQEVAPLAQEDDMPVMEQQFTEMQTTVKTLTERLDASEATAAAAKTAQATAEQQVKTYEERVATLETKLQASQDAREYADILTFTRTLKHVPGKPEELATRLQKVKKLDGDEYTARLAEYKAMNEANKAAFAEIGSGQGGGGQSASQKLTELTQAAMAEKKIEFGSAWDHVCREHVGLFREYQHEARQNGRTTEE